MKSHLLLFLLSLLFTLSLSINEEGLHLLEAKKALEDPNNYLSDWNSKDTTPCNWKGITCPSTSVTSIDLSNLGLLGPFPYTFCNLTKLSFLNLQLNYINASLDDPFISHCTSLTHIDLSMNELVGPLPSSLAHLPLLEYLDLSANNFSGEIPASFGLFPKLKVLSLTNNLLTSTVPEFLGNVLSLTQLNLSYNLFSPSSIPPSFGNLASLQQLWLSGCSLIGPIPETLGKLSNLQNLDVSTNNLTGSVPESFTNLSSLVQLELYENNLSGLFPNGFSKIKSLLRIDASNNNFEGFIPDDLFDVTRLESLRLASNRFNGEISPNVAKMKSLFELILFDNQLSGSLPSDLGKNSPLISIDVSYNNFTGEIPSSLCSSGKLENLLLIENSFSGSIPNEIGDCKSLRRVRLSNNKLSGNVPDGLWGLPHVGLLELSGNSLSGEISAFILTASNLSNLIISDNEFTGSVPPEIGSLHKLYKFFAANNKLSGPLPSSLTNLDQLGVLDLHSNLLSGEFISGTGKLKKLTELNLADNEFSGTIPPELGDLPVLNYIDLSGNKFSGKLPSQLQNLKLNKFNMSNNQLNGPLPPMFINGNYRTSFLNNPGLCGDLPDLCPGSKGDFHRSFTWIFKAIFVIAALMLVTGIGWFYVRYIKFKKLKMNDKSKWTLTSFHKLGFSEYEILDCLDEDNVIGSGASGKVYKATLSSGNVVAVKKLWNTSKVVDRFGDDAFDAEVTTLGKIRHKNIVKLWCSCSHKDCKMLVYEYMPNGSLGDLLHSKKGSMLDWPMRYKIALDAAEGLSYLHHGCVPPIVHRDVKSNNILLDSDFGAKVADFGVAKAVDSIGNGAKSMSVIAGSCGYIAPEYAYTLRVNEKSDIYSFGVVILELVTGKLPVDPEFGEKDLVRWVCSTIEQKGVEHVFDPNLDLTLFKEEINQVLNIGLQCTSNLPMNRPSMRRVVKMLLEMVPDVDDKSKEKDGKQSPYYYEDTSSYQGNIV